MFRIFKKIIENIKKRNQKLIFFIKKGDSWSKNKSIYKILKENKNMKKIARNKKMKKITRNKIKNKEEFCRSEYWIPVIRSNWESYASLVCLKTIYQNTVTNQFRAHQWHSIWIFGDLFQINIDSIESKMMYFMKIASNEKRRTFISILPKLIQTYSISNWHEYFWFFIFRYDMWVIFMNFSFFFSSYSVCFTWNNTIWG